MIPATRAIDVSPPPRKLSVVRGIQQVPIWTHLYAPEGTGKSTFGAGAPDPIFIDVEAGTAHLDVPRFEFDDGRTQPETWPEVLSALSVLATEPHTFKTAVVDTLDATEALIFSHICARDKKASIEDYGYGKGYVAAVDEWRLFVAACEKLLAKKMHVVTLSHASIRPFKNPEGDDFDRYEMRLNQKAAGLIKERAHNILFAQLEMVTFKDERTKRVKGSSTGARIIRTTRTAAFDAKNRYDLPDELPLSWDDYWRAVQERRPADPKKLVEAIIEKSKLLGGEIETSSAKFVVDYKDNAAALAKLNDRLNAKLSEKSSAQEE